MSKGVALVLVLVFLTASCMPVATRVSAFSPNSWASKASMQVARSSLSVAVVNEKIYAIGGYVEAGVVTGVNEEYDSETDTWAFRTPMPTPRADFATAVCQNKIYCIGGYLSNGTVTGVNEVYDPATDTWETKASMPTPRSYITANVVNGKIYLIGGDSNRTINEVYDPATDSWTTAAPMPTGSYGYASAVVDSKIYIIDSNLNQIYNVETNTWSLGASPPGRLGYGKAGATTGVNALKRIYVLGEVVYEQPCLNQVYDSQHDRWTYGVAVPTSRNRFAVAVVNDMLYVIGGFTMRYVGFERQAETGEMYEYTFYATNEQYTPFGYGTPDPSYDGTAPEITVTSPENKTYYTVDVALNFTVNEPVTAMHYKLDNETAVEISANITLAGLSYGAHNLTVYAVDPAGNIGISGTVHFTIAKEPEPFPTAWIAPPVIIAAVASAVFLIYLRKNRRRNHAPQHG